MKNLSYRDFIVFDMNTFKIDLLLTDKFNAYLTLLIKSIGVIDKETLITNINNPEGELYVEKEFQHIIKMDSGDSKNETDRASSNPNNRLSSDFNLDDSILISELDNNVTDEKISINAINDIKINKKVKKDSQDNYFLVLNFEHNNEAQTQYANILLKKNKSMCCHEFT